MRMKACCTALLIGLLVSPAMMADVIAGFDPVDTSVGFNQTFWVDIVADIDVETPIVGWGLDLIVDDPTIAAPTGNLDFTTGPWDAAFASDGDGLAGLNFPDGVTGQCVLVSVEFQSFGNVGTTVIGLGDDNPTDLTEGFAIVPPPSGVFADVTYCCGSIYVPEPAALTLLTLGGLALLRRR